MEKLLDRRQLLLAALFPFVALSLLNHFYNAPLLAWHPGWFWAADIVQWVLVPVACYALLLRPARIAPAEVGLQIASDRVGMAWRTLFTVILLVTFSWPVCEISWRVGCEYSDPLVIHRAMPAGRAAHWFVAIYLSVAAAWVEEVAYRALPWLYLHDKVPARWRDAVYVLLTSLLFAAAHSEQGPGGMFAAWWFGLLTAWHYARRRNLWPLILAHFILDMIAFAP